MPSPTNHIDGLHPKLQILARDFMAACAKVGLNVGIHQGFRSVVEQNKLYTKGGVTRAKGGYSWHNYGLAFDAVFVDHNGKWKTSSHDGWGESHDWQKLGMIGKGLGLVWGGDWKSIVDRPHFQMTNGLSIREAIAMYRKGGIKKVWEAVDARSH